jgi:hypothetical protein
MFFYEDKMGFNLTKLKYRQAIWIQDGLNFLVLFFIVLFYLHPPLFYELQHPVFFTNGDFLKEHLMLPGGLADYLSVLFSQGLEYPILGAFILAFTIGLVSLFTRKLIQVLWKTQVHTVHWIPGIFLFFLYARFEAPLSLAIGTAVALISTWLFLRRPPKSIGVRAALYTLGSGLLYWFCGGPFLFFAIFCAIWEWIDSKSPLRGMIYLVISAVWCVIGPAFFFLVFSGKACANNLSIEASYPPAFARWGLLLFFPLTGFFSFIVKPFSKFLETRFKSVKNQALIGGTVLILSIFCTGGWITFESQFTKRLMLLRAAGENDWETVLRLGKEPSIANPHTCVQVNRALWHTGQLLDSAFAYPQINSTLGLLPSKSLCVENQEAASDLFFELGLISESLHWGIEYMEIVGKTPKILDRIGVIYLLKGDIETAKVFWNKLKYTLQGKTKALNRLSAAEEKDLLEKDKTLRELSNSIPQVDFIVQVNLTDRELLPLLRQNPQNLMAFEYWVAYQLFEGNLGSVWNIIKQFRAREYQRIPRHVQEALVLYAYLSKLKRLDLLKPYVDPSLFGLFTKFQQTLTQQPNESSVRKELKKEFGDTYWYYLRFEKKDKP